MGGHDSYDFTDVAGRIRIYDDAGDDDYFTTGGNHRNIEVKDFGYGSNTMIFLTRVGLELS